MRPIYSATGITLRPLLCILTKPALGETTPSARSIASVYASAVPELVPYSSHRGVPNLCRAACVS